MLFQGILVTYIIYVQASAITSQDEETIQPVDLNFKCEKPASVGRKSPILFIHGLFGSLENWDSVIGLVNRTGRMACAVDLRNHGDSPWSNRTDVDSMVVDIEHLLDKYKVPKVNIIGHSLGGKVAVDFTLKNPDMVNSLVVEDMRANGVTEQVKVTVQNTAQFLRDAMRQVPEGSSVDEARNSIRDYLKRKQEEGVDTGFVNDDVINYLEIQCTAGKCQYKFNIEALAEAVQDFPSFLGESRGLYRGPTLFIYGELSEIDVPGAEDNIMELFPEARLVEVKNAGHSIHGEFKEFEDEVANLLNQIPC